MITRRPQLRILRTLLIWIASGAAVFLVGSFAPSLSNASINVLFRLRGELPPPNDILIVAIDDPSLQVIGRYPWDRSVIAEALDKISSGRPKAVGIDIIFAEEADRGEDDRLAAAIRQNGRVVLPTLLFERADEAGQSRVDWLTPIGVLDEAVASKGHVHAAPGVDGTLRSIQLSKADDEGHRIWAFGLETVRVAQDITGDPIESSGLLKFGPHNIRVLPEGSDQSLVEGVSITRSNEMLINYIGGTNSIPYLSFADVFTGKVPADTFTDKIVLVGATSPTLGDIQVTPFMQYVGADGRQGGQAMPGVEVHANVINTIRNGLSLQPLAEGWSYALVLLIILVITLAVKWLEGAGQVVALASILAVIAWGCLIAFDQYFLILPVPELLTAFFFAAPLLLLDRSLSASRDLDLKLSVLSAAQKGFLQDEDGSELPRFVPHNLEWKLRAVDSITTRLLSRMSFINRVLIGMSEGVMVADLSGRIVFVNPPLEAIFGQDLRSRDLIEILMSWGMLSPAETETIGSQVKAFEIVQKEVVINSPEHRNLLLQFSAVTPGTEIPLATDIGSGYSPVMGILILVFDVTKQRELDRLRAETLQFVSHELRSPLTSIQGLSDVLQKFDVSASESREMLETIHSEAIRLNKIITRFLDTKRLESGVQELHIAALDINKLLSGAIGSVAPLAAEKGIHLKHVVNDGLPILTGDDQLLTQAVENLLSNAVKYSDPGTEVKVYAVSDTQELKIVVSDAGFGIPPDKQERIFEKFYRLPRDESSNVTGSGLGLSFVKDTVEKHGGYISVNSAVGDGTMFTLSFPYDAKLSHSPGFGNSNMSK